MRRATWRHVTALHTRIEACSGLEAWSGMWNRVEWYPRCVDCLTAVSHSGMECSNEPCKLMQRISHLRCWQHRRSRSHVRTVSGSLATKCSAGGAPPVGALLKRREGVGECV